MIEKTVGVRLYHGVMFIGKFSPIINMRKKSDPERRAKPVSERDFLAGEIPRVFETPSLLRYYVVYHGKGHANSAQ
ncbi:MAG: hypothetical protein GTN73_04935 [Candidatus Aminicenantes bacterium]|nr:hypothetical protein [Candidatus Aminicenantes bacterium]